MNREDELLFAALALGAGMIRPSEFASACNEWLTSPQTTLAERLQDQGALSSRDRSTLEEQLQSERTSGILPRPAVDETKAVTEPNQADGASVSSRTLDAAGPSEPISRARGSDPTESFEASDVPEHRVGAHPTSEPRYRRLDRIGQGGMGQVWRCLDQVLGREVALKVIRPDRPVSRSIQERFLIEARITGQLQHPGIVPVFDLEATPAIGETFYTMRYVAGRTLKDASKTYQERLEAGLAGPRDLLELLSAFVSVCQAVAYAHDRGVLHRDLKGPNVILGDFGEVHVLDWGLAKALGEPNGDTASSTSSPPIVEQAEAETLASRPLGTLSYMAPEATGQRAPGVAIDQRTDVYGLGAILYEILTGRPPFSDKDSNELIRKVREEPPEPPRRRCPSTPKALEAICLKALAKAPADRYPSATELADEIRRWIADEPVLAYPEPWPTRLARWARRHRSTVAGTAILLVTLALGLAIFSAVIAAKNRELAIARAEAEENAQAALVAQEQAEANQDEAEQHRAFALANQAVAEQQRDIAEENFAEARDLALGMLRILEVIKNELAQTPEVETARKAMTTHVLDTFRKIYARRPDETRTRQELASVCREMGKIHELFDDQIASAEVYGEEVVLIEALTVEFPEVPAYRNLLAQALRNYSQPLGKLGRLRQAAEALNRAIDQADALLVAEPNDDYRRSLATAQLERSGLEMEFERLEEAARSAESALEPARVVYNRPEPRAQDAMVLALILNRFGLVLTKLDRTGEAEERFDEAIELAQDLVRRTKGNNNLRHVLARCQLGKAELLARDPERWEEAEAHFVKAASLWELLAEEYKDYTAYRGWLASTLNGRGALHLAGGRLNDAEADFERAVALLVPLIDNAPNRPGHQGDIGRVFANLGRLSMARDRIPEAIRRFEISVAWMRLAVAASPESQVERSSLNLVFEELETIRQRP